ncbi:hypothetical protein BC826DRAFT_90236 [Russula brevipes]|nr:hypothetical protein BC826DRAFT_90236 [Russula brevipes]
MVQERIRGDASDDCRRRRLMTSRKAVGRAKADCNALIGKSEPCLDWVCRVFQGKFKSGKHTLIAMARLGFCPPRVAQTSCICIHDRQLAFSISHPHLGHT